MFKKYVIVFLISMVPLIELRGAVPVGFSNAFGDALPLLPLYITCIIGNMLPVPFIFFFARKVLQWGADKKFIGKFFTWCLEKGEKGRKKITTNSRTWFIYRFIYLCWYTTSRYRCLDRNSCC